MSKRTSTSGGVNPAKRARKTAGFRVARSSSTLKEPHPTSKSVFVTLTHPDEQRGTLIGQTRVLSNTPDPPQPPSASAADSDVPDSTCLDPDPESEDLPTLPDGLPPEEVPLKRKRHTKNVVCYSCNSYILVICFNFDLQDQLREWTEFRATFLDEALRHDGLADFLGHTDCARCAKALGIFKCIDCPSGRMLKCVECIIALHQSLPLHRVEVSWCLYRVM